MSVFVAARRVGASVEVAYLIQVLAAVLAAAVVTVVWLRNAPAGIENEVVLLGACLATLGPL